MRVSFSLLFFADSLPTGRRATASSVVVVVVFVVFVVVFVVVVAAAAAAAGATKPLPLQQARELCQNMSSQQRRSLDPRNPANAAALRSFQMQNQIRQNTMKLNDQFADLARWEKAIKRKDAELVEKGMAARSRNSVPVRGVRGGAAAAAAASSSSSSSLSGAPTTTVRTRLGRGAVSAPIEELQKQQALASQQQAAPAEAVGSNQAAKPKEGSAASHTYDKGYKKWEKFDVDKAIEEVEVEDVTQSHAQRGGAGGVGPVPAHVVSGDKPKEPVYVARTMKPTRSAPSDIGEIFELERKKGNDHFGRGEFSAAIQCYTKCIGYDSRNPVVYSNRAAAYLKTKEYLKARSDCDSALRLDPAHSKSLLRRATANNSLGRHRAALRDLTVALAAAPSNKRLKSEVQKTKELHRTSIRKAPRWKVDVSFAAGPALPRPVPSKPLSSGQGVAGDNHSGAIRSQATAAPPKKSGLKAINAVDDGMEDVPINRRRKETAQKKASAAKVAVPLTLPNDSAVEHMTSSETSSSEATSGAAVVPDDQTSTSNETMGVQAQEPSSIEEAAAPSPQSPAQRQAAAAANTASAAAARRAFIEKASSPKTNYEFVNCWNGCVIFLFARTNPINLFNIFSAFLRMRTRFTTCGITCLCSALDARLRTVEEQAFYLRLIPTKNIKAVFKTAPESDVFSSLLQALVVVVKGSERPDNGLPPAKPKPKRAVIFLQRLAASLRFGMAVMLFSDADKTAITQIVASVKDEGKRKDLSNKYGL